MKKLKIFLIAGGAVSLVLIGLSAMFAFSGLSSAVKEREGMERSFSELNAFYKKNPFPNKRNVGVESSNLTTINEWNTNIVDKLRNAIFAKDKGVSPGNFYMLHEQTVNSLVKNAPKVRAGSTNSVVNAGFDFGFGRYTTGVPPDKDDVPRLMRQLKMMEYIMTNIMYASGVYKVDVLKRDEFEEAQASANAPAAMRPRGGGFSATVVNFDFSPMSQGSIPVERERFGIVFTASQSALFSVLNIVNESWPFMMVSFLEFTKEGNDVVFPSATAAATGGADSKVVNPRPPSKTARTVSGQNREALLRVVMTVDFLMIGSEENSGSN